MADVPEWLLGGLQWAEQAPTTWSIDIATLDGTGTSAATATDIVEVALCDATVDGDHSSSIAVLRLADERWLYVSYHPPAGITDDPYWSFVFAGSFQRVWWWAMTDDERERFDHRIAPDAREDLKRLAVFFPRWLTEGMSPFNESRSEFYTFDRELDTLCPLADDVVEIAYLSPFGGDTAVAIARLADGRWMAVKYRAPSPEHSTPHWHFTFARTRQRLWWYALDHDDRARLTCQMTAEALDDELVEIDMLLETTYPEAIALAEARIQQRHGKR